MSLTPVPTPIGIFPAFFTRNLETIVLKEKVLSWSGDDFHIKLANGTPILRVDGKVWSLGGRKNVYDMSGTHLFTIRKELMHLVHTTFVLEAPDGGKIMEVRNSFKLIGSKATATFTSQSGKQEVLTMTGSWTDYSANITDEAQGGVLVASVSRKILSGKDIFFGQQTYGVQVAPGVDMALIAAMCICLDEKNNEGS